MALDKQGRARFKRASAKKRVAMKIPSRALAGFRRIFGGAIPAGAMEQIRREYRKNPAGAFQRCVAALKGRPGVISPAGVCAVAGRKKLGAAEMARRAAAGRRRRSLGKKNVAAAPTKKRKRNNPDEAAAERYELFHGRGPDKVHTIHETVHEHETLSGIGKLVSLTVAPVDGTAEIVLSGFRGSLLAQDEQGTQLYVKGGDQAVEVAGFGITTPHELEVLGAVTEVEYFTTKDHLGKDGGTATYTHKFGGRGSRLPVLMYDTVNRRLSFAGGGYDLPEVGIRG